MKGGKRPLGYTIIEVMIVLAVSGVMFLIAASFINGKQERTAFQEGVIDLTSQIQDIIQQVTSGEYSDVPVSCNSGDTLSFTGSVSPTQGTQLGCVYIGKLLYFSNNGADSYEAFTIAGNRLIPGTQNPAIKMSDIVPTPVYNAGPSAVDLTTQYTIPQSLNVKSITADGTTSYGFGFIQSPGTSVGTVGPDTLAYSPGGQTINLFVPTHLNTAGLSETAITNSVPLGYDYPATSATICLTDGTQFATISVGDSNTNGNQLSATAQILGTTGNATCH